jgi:hypothetical protein
MKLIKVSDNSWINPREIAEIIITNAQGRACMNIYMHDGKEIIITAAYGFTYDEHNPSAGPNFVRIFNEISEV